VLCLLFNVSVWYVCIYKRAKEREMNIIKNILENDEYSTNLIEKSPPQKQDTHTDR
jgi:hypothetical protein